MKSIARAFISALVLSIAIGCDETARAVRDIQRPLDPIIGTWREVVPNDTAPITTLIFSSDGSTRQTILRRAPADSSLTSATDSLTQQIEALVSSLPLRWSRGEDVLVLSIDNKTLIKALQSTQTESLRIPEENQGDTVGVKDFVLKYKLSGDVLEITPEKDDMMVAEPRTARFVRVRK